MSRVFKNKGKGNNKEADGEGASGATLKMEAPKVEKPSQIDKGITLVEETPVKSRLPSAFLGEAKGQQRQPIAPLTFGDAKLLPDEGKLASVNEGDDDDEEWMVDSSPNIVLFDPLLEKRKKSKMQSTSDRGDITPINEEGSNTVQKVETQVTSSQPRRTRKPLKKKAKR